MRNPHAGIPFDTSTAEIAEALQDVSIPTLMLFKDGEVEATKVGALTKIELAKFLDSNI